MLMKNFLKITQIGFNLTKLSKFNLFTKNIFKTQSFINKNMNFRFTTDNTVNEKHALEYIESGVFEVLKGTAKCKVDKLNRSATMDELGKLLYI